VEREARDEPKIAARVASLAVLREKFPAIFDIDQPVPLAIGASTQIEAALGPDSAEAAHAVARWWTSGPRYLAEVAAEGSMRWNLDGTPAGDVTDEHTAIAAERLAALRKQSAPIPEQKA
jgi:sRNA-binding protein